METAASTPALGDATGDRRRKALAVISGGLDSTVMAYLLQSQGYRLSAISFDYGQRHRKELAFAERAARGLGSEWRLIDLAAAGIASVIGGSALTSSTVDVPEGHYAAENMRVTVVPNRNAIMLAIAYAAAATSQSDVVAIAVHAGDHPIYPDCRPEFLSSFERMEESAMGSESPIRLAAPFTTMSKAEIVELGARLDVPFSETWSCYRGEDVHCGACGTCYERREAFEIAGVKDPTTYAATPRFAAP